jgi:4-hydroxy-4-methyl-2-oxoglutarate aldolase
MREKSRVTKMEVITQTVVGQYLKFDPATLYEAAGRRGMVDPEIRPAWPGARICGRALTVECPPGDNLTLHQAVAVAQPGDVLVATTGGYLRTGAWGEILTIAAQVRGIVGLAIDGAVRDIEATANRQFPVFSRGLAIGACTKERPGMIGLTLQFGGVVVRPGDFIFGNVDGLVILEQERIEEICQAAVARQHYEAEIMDQLRAGKTTLELLGLPDGNTVYVR